MTTTVEVPTAGHQGLLARHPLVSFFVIAYAGSWILALPYVRFAGGTGLLPFVIGFGAVALLLIVFTRGRLGYDHYLQQAEEEPAPGMVPA